MGMCGRQKTQLLVSTGNLALSTVGLVATIACVPFETVTWNKTKCAQEHRPGINKHFSMLSSNQDFFDQAVPIWVEQVSLRPASAKRWSHEFVLIPALVASSAISVLAALVLICKSTVQENYSLSPWLTHSAKEAISSLILCL